MFTAFRKRSVGIVAGLAFVLSVPAAAYATEISSSISGASAATFSSRAGASVKDTLSDGMRADADYKRGATDAGVQTVSDTNGSGNGWVRSGTGSTKIVEIRACRRNSNPLQGNACDAWRTLGF